MAHFVTLTGSMSCPPDRSAYQEDLKLSSNRKSWEWCVSFRYTLLRDLKLPRRSLRLRLPLVSSRPLCWTPWSCLRAKKIGHIVGAAACVDLFLGRIHVDEGPIYARLLLSFCLFYGEPIDAGMKRAHHDVEPSLGEPILVSGFVLVKLAYLSMADMLHPLPGSRSCRLRRLRWQRSGSSKADVHVICAWPRFRHE